MTFAGKVSLVCTDRSKASTHGGVKRERGLQTLAANYRSSGSSQGHGAMQVAYYEKTGSARDVLRMGERPDPAPGPGEVRVRLHCSGVNPSDVKSRAGRRNSAMPFPLVVPHSDGAGVIDRVGDGVPDARIGERVWVWNAAWGRSNGTAAQYITLPARQAVALPEGTEMEAGACFGIPALTALHAVQSHGGVRGKVVLVAGGAGAVGHYAVQFARRLGAR